MITIDQMFPGLTDDEYATILAGRLTADQSAALAAHDAQVTGRKIDSSIPGQLAHAIRTLAKEW